jgi:lipopolysaccharide transport system ATP-binding protein
VREGETVGIIGRNGSGRSTLLEVVCGTPTTSQVKISGRVPSLLGLGAGFTCEFGGRESGNLNGGVLDVSREEFGNRFEAIAAFPVVEERIDQSVKRNFLGFFRYSKIAA